nr:hypothetical protein [Methylobacterium sp. J-059]
MPLLVRYDDRDRLPLGILGDLVNGNGRKQALGFKRSALLIGTFGARVVALMGAVVNVEEVASPVNRTIRRADRHKAAGKYNLRLCNPERWR